MVHFLITRFNLQNKHFINFNESLNPVSEKWLNDRFKLFEEYCLPSVRNQSNQNFKWCIFFDTETPKNYIEKIKSLEKLYQNIIIKFCNGFEAFDDIVVQDIEQLISRKDDYVITTRLDNDDIIHKDFIKTIQDNFIKKNNTIIDLPIGYQLIKQDNYYDSRIFNNKFNPFISLIESTKNIKTVISKPHRDWKKVETIISYNKSKLWIQFIHNQNLVNKKHFFLKRINNLKFKDFGFENIPNLKQGIFIHNLISFPIRTLKKINQFWQ